MLLLCGLVSSVYYLAINLFVAAQSPGYSSVSQTVSELSAIDAPTRALWVALCTAYGLLLIAFGVGVRWTAGNSRPLRIAGYLIIAHGVFGFFWPPMHSRDVLAAGGGTLTDILHIAWTAVVGVLSTLYIGFAAAAFGRRFRVYSIASVVLMWAFGMLTGAESPALQANLPTPWIGLWERLGMTFWLVWVAVLSAALLWTREKRESVPGSIHERSFMRLGGIDQWVTIRGESASNPLLIVLHGGPGFSETWLMRYFNAVLEKSFTVVYWDQRGAGRSFHRHIPASSMNVEQFIGDLDELVDRVRHRFGHARVTIFGHSWGSALGALYAARYPDKVAVYVGGSQIGDWPASEAASYASVLAEAERQNNRRALKALRAIGPPPYEANSVFVERTWSQRLDGQLSLKMLWGTMRIIFGGPEFSSVFNLRKNIRGFRFSLNALWPEVSTLNLRKAVPELRMPVFVFVGRRDRWVPPETSVAYFDELIAPSKTLVWFENSGHEHFADEADKFNRTMVEAVRPAALANAHIITAHEEDRDAPRARGTDRAVA